MKCKCCQEEIEAVYGFAYCKTCWEDKYGEKLDEMENEDNE